MVKESEYVAMLLQEKLVSESPKTFLKLVFEIV